jgi:uncharacterized membrane protein YkvA (DUF1232 family)
MLFQLVERICNDIDRIEAREAAPLVLNQLRHSAPETIAEMVQEGRKNGNDDATEDVVTTLLAMILLWHVKNVPTLARRMVAAMNDSRIPAARRCAVAGVLAYLVQPHDFIPDHLPGGYGYLDDVIFIRAGLVEYLNMLPEEETSVDAERNLLALLVRMAPQAIRPGLQQGITAMSLAVQLFSFIPSPIAELMIGQIVANPLQMAPPAAPRGFVPRSVPDYAKGHWSHGAYFEGNNVVIPGGPSLIDGSLFIPS